MRIERGLEHDQACRSNYAFKPIAELALRPKQTVVPQRLNAALDVQRAFRGIRQDETGSTSTAPGDRFGAKWRADASAVRASLLG